MASTSTAETSLAVEEFPNWVEMPDELMTNILQRLRTVEVLNNARKVCSTWWRICKNPAMWKVIHVRLTDDFKWYEDLKKLTWPRDPHSAYLRHLEKLTKQAVDLSCGELIDISIEGFGSDDLLDHIVLRLSKLKRLSLNPPLGDITGSGLTRTVKRVPQLEELELYFLPITGEDIQVIGRNCPQLKSFLMVKDPEGLDFKCDDHALAIANNMPELRRLELRDEEMTNNGFQAILKGCPHLEFLDVCGCVNLNVDGNLEKQCMERIKDFKYSLPKSIVYSSSSSSEEDDDDSYDWFKVGIF